MWITFLRRSVASLVLICPSTCLYGPVLELESIMDGKAAVKPKVLDETPCRRKPACCNNTSAIKLKPLHRAPFQAYRTKPINPKPLHPITIITSITIFLLLLLPSLQLYILLLLLHLVLLLLRKIRLEVATEELAEVFLRRSQAGTSSCVV